MTALGRPAPVRSRRLNPSFHPPGDKSQLPDYVAISFNSDVGDSWEWADAPHYPEKYSALGIRIGVNYVIYAMTD
jgi:hypothetical protein